MRISDWSSDVCSSDLKRGRWGGCLPWAIIGAVLFAIFAIWKFPSFKAQAELGSAYAARVGCSCRYVQGRSLESCQSDFVPGMEMVSLSEDPATRTVTGSVPLLASSSARYAGASGFLKMGRAGGRERVWQ